MILINCVEQLTDEEAKKVVRYLALGKAHVRKRMFPPKNGG